MLVKSLTSEHLERGTPSPSSLVDGLPRHAPPMTQMWNVEVHTRKGSGRKGKGGLPGTEWGAACFVELAKEWIYVPFAVPAALHTLDHMIYPFMQITSSPFISEKREAQRG